MIVVLHWWEVLTKCICWWIFFHPFFHFILVSTLIFDVSSPFLTTLICLRPKPSFYHHTFPFLAISFTQLHTQLFFPKHYTVTQISVFSLCETPHFFNSCSLSQSSSVTWNSFGSPFTPFVLLTSKSLSTQLIHKWKIYSFRVPNI